MHSVHFYGVVKAKQIDLVESRACFLSFFYSVSFNRLIRGTLVVVSLPGSENDRCCNVTWLYSLSRGGVRYLIKYFFLVN